MSQWSERYLSYLGIKNKFIHFDEIFHKGSRAPNFGRFRYSGLDSLKRFLMTVISNI